MARTPKDDRATPTLSPEEQVLVEAVREWCALPAVERVSTMKTKTRGPLAGTIERLRAQQLRRQVPAHIVAVIEAVPGWHWSKTRERLGLYLDAARRFADQHGLENAFHNTTYEGLEIGKWLNMQRAQYREGQVSVWLRAQLEALPGWTPIRGKGPAGARWLRETTRRHLDALRERVARGQTINYFTRKDTAAADHRFFDKIRTYFLQLRKDGRLPAEMQAELEELPGWAWPLDPENDDPEGLRLLRGEIAAGVVPRPHPGYVVRGFRLGPWLRTCRERHAKGLLTDELRRELETLPGWRWLTPQGHAERRKLELLRAVVAKMPLTALARDPIHEGVNLQSWVHGRRMRYREGKLPATMVVALEALPGWSWAPSEEASPVASARTALGTPAPIPAASPTRERFDRRGRKSSRSGITPLEAEYVRLIRAYLAAHEHLEAHDAVQDGVPLRQAISSFRAQYKRSQISADVAKALEAIPGWSWDPLADRFHRNLELVRRFLAAHGFDALTDKIVVDGVHLGQWFTMQRSQYNTGQLARRWRRELESLPDWRAHKGRDAFFAQQRRETALHHLELLRKHYSGEQVLPDSGVHINGLPSLQYIREFFKKAIKLRALDPDLRQELDSIPGMSLDLRGDRRREYLALLRKLAGSQGLPYVTFTTVVDGVKIGPWVDLCCRKYREGRLDPALVAQLEAIRGWTWKPSPEEVHARKLRLLTAFLQEREFADLRHHPRHEGINLYEWVATMRKEYKRGKLSDERVREFEALPGWSWAPNTDRSKAKGWPVRRRRREDAERSTEGEERARREVAEEDGPPDRPLALRSTTG